MGLVEREKIFFKAGDVVRIAQDVPCPSMVVKHVNKYVKKEDGERSVLIGVTCFWFTKDDAYQCQLFSTKDLRHVKA